MHLRLDLVRPIQSHPRPVLGILGLLDTLGPLGTLGPPRSLKPIQTPRAHLGPLKLTWPIRHSQHDLHGCMASVAHFIYLFIFIFIINHFYLIIYYVIIYLFILIYFHYYESFLVIQLFIILIYQFITLLFIHLSIIIIRKFWSMRAATRFSERERAPLENFQSSHTIPGVREHHWRISEATAQFRK